MMLLRYTVSGESREHFFAYCTRNRTFEEPSGTHDILYLWEKMKCSSKLSKLSEAQIAMPPNERRLLRQLQALEPRPRARNPRALQIPATVPHEAWWSWGRFTLH
jgi:hypothetical protein